MLLQKRFDGLPEMAGWLKWPTNTKEQHILYSTCLSFGNQNIYMYLMLGETTKQVKSEQGGGQWKSRGARTSYQILVEVIITIWRVCWQICNDILHINLLLILIISCKGASRVELSLRITSISMNLKEGMGNSQLAKLCCLSRTANPCSTNVKPHTYVPTRRAEHCVHRSDP